MSLLLRLVEVLIVFGVTYSFFLWWRRPNLKALKEMHTFSDLGILLFSATWCGPCKNLKARLKPMLEDELKDIEYKEIDVDENPDYAQKYRIRSIPTLILFNGDDILITSHSLDDVLIKIREQKVELL